MSNESTPAKVFLYAGAVALAIGLFGGIAILLDKLSKPDPATETDQSASEVARATVLFENTAGDVDRVKMVELEDGTRCALYEGFRKGGISCDWKHQNDQ